jgi:hypothetical protein
MRMRSIPQSVSNRLAPYRASFKSAPAVGQDLVIFNVYL